MERQRRRRLTRRRHRRRRPHHLLAPPAQPPNHPIKIPSQPRAKRVRQRKTPPRRSPLHLVQQTLRRRVAHHAPSIPLAPQRLRHMGRPPHHRRLRQSPHCQRPRRPQHLALRPVPPHRNRTPRLRPIRPPPASHRSPHWHRRPAPKRRRRHRQTSRPHLRPLRAIHRRPLRLRPKPPQPGPWSIRQPAQPLVHGPMAPLVPRHHLPPALPPLRRRHRHHPLPHPESPLNTASSSIKL